jgi:hypothetical protein
MAFDPLEERRRRGMQGMLNAPAPPAFGRGGMLSAAGMPPVRAMGMSSPYMPSQTYPGSNPNRPMMFPTYQDALDYYIANPSPGIDRPNPADWTTPSPTPQIPTGMLDPIPQQQSEAWWAAQPRPSFVPSDWVYIGMGDWGPPSEQTVPGAEYGPDTSALAPLPGGMPFIPPSDAS